MVPNISVNPNKKTKKHDFWGVFKYSVDSMNFDGFMDAWSITILMEDDNVVNPKNTHHPQNQNFYGHSDSHSALSPWGAVECLHI